MPRRILQGLMALMISAALLVAFTPHARANTMAAPLDAAGMDCNALGCNLYSKLIATEKGNVFISPYSLESGLVMTFLGARGNTALQMRQALCLPKLKGIDPDPPASAPDQAVDQPGRGGNFVGGSISGGDVPMPRSYVVDGFKLLHRDLNPPVNVADPNKIAPFELRSVNVLWGQKSLDFQKPYLDEAHDIFGGGLTPLDFAGDPEGSRQTINLSIEAQTKGRIKDLLPARSVDARTDLVLTNAIYFKAAWQFPFDPRKTKDDAFSLYGDFIVGSKAPNSDSRSISRVQVPFMAQTRQMKYASTADAQIVELNYAGGTRPDEVRMVIIMPHDSDKLAAMEKDLQPATLWRQVEAAKNTRVEIHLPRFKFASPAYNLAVMLKSLGMTDAFDPAKADFSKITGKRELFIGGVFHKAFVEVDEAGTEAAAATGVTMSHAAIMVEPPPVAVKIDKPFLFYIQKGTTILFLGRITDPRG